MPRWPILVLLVLVAGLVGTPPRAATPKFFSDDPIADDPETLDAAGVEPVDLTETYDFVENTFFNKADRRDIRAVNVNTIDEVPNSSWFTNRVGTAEILSVEDIVRGPYRHPGPRPGRWTVVSAKAEGITPGFVATDSAGDTYFVKFDPPSNPEMASGAEVISTRFFHAFGYNVPENFLATFRREDLDVAPTAQFENDRGRKRRMTQGDVSAILTRAARRPDGAYRALASLRLAGQHLGPFRYYGTRPDDPNDIHAHEHRRELRGLRVFAAWLNHDDSRAINSGDFLQPQATRRLVRHYLIDFGSTLGSGSTQAQKPRAGNEYIWDARPTVLSMVTLGFYVRPWVRVKYPDLPAVGRFEAAFFAPELWKPEYPNPAYDNVRPDDAFWAARRVVAFGNAAIEAVVGAAEYSDPASAAYLTQTLITRRDKVARHWLNVVLPLVDCGLTPSGRLTCTNVAVEARAAEPPTGYQVRWGRFDNATGESVFVGDPVTVTVPSAEAPRSLVEQAEFILAEWRGSHPQHPGWRTPLRLYFRRTTSGWRTVGVERQ